MRNMRKQSFFGFVEKRNQCCSKHLKLVEHHEVDIGDKELKKKLDGH